MKQKKEVPKVVPIQPLWLEKGRVYLEPISINAKSVAGIDTKEESNIYVRTGKVLGLTKNLETDLKIGDYVLYNIMSGGVLKLDFYRGGSKISALIHAMDVMGVWSISPLEYYPNARIEHGRYEDVIVSEVEKPAPEGFSSDREGLTITKVD